MNAILSEPLQTLQSLSQTLFQSLSPPQTKPPPPPPISHFIDADLRLSKAIQLARVHQTKQRRIEQLKTELLELESRWREICRELESGKKELESMIEEGDERCKAIEEAKNGKTSPCFLPFKSILKSAAVASIPYPELLAYAQSLSAFTSAPPNMPDLSQPGQLPPPLFFPPFPNEEKMRRGRLNAEAPLGILGETHSVGRREFLELFNSLLLRPIRSAPSASPKPMDVAPTGGTVYRQDSRMLQQPFDFDLDLNPDL